MFVGARCEWTLPIGLPQKKRVFVLMRSLARHLLGKWCRLRVWLRRRTRVGRGFGSDMKGQKK